MTQALKQPNGDYGEAAIRQALKTQLIGHDLVFLERTTSTNVAAKKLARKGCADGLTVVANHQTAGKGRLGRRWSAPVGTDVLVSIVLRPQISPERSAALTGMASLAVATAIENLCGLEPEIKWPNDVLVGGKKACGILTEGDVRNHELAFAVVGIGINCNRERKTFRKPLNETATSLLIEAGRPVDRAALLAAVLANMEAEYLQFRSSGLSHIVPDLRKRLWRLDREVTVRTGAAEVVGLCLGLDDEGRLLVRDNEGQQHAFWGGEIVHVR